MNRFRLQFQVGFYCCVVSIAGVAFTVRADTVKLKDGTVLQGDILSENETQLVIEAEYASGTIIKQETVNKSDAVEITRLTPEERAKREMERAFAKLRRYQLDPSNSLPLDHYDYVMNDVFRRFLSQYPDSPHEIQVEDRLAEWIAERNKVAHGLVKLGGQWMSAEEMARLPEQQRVHLLLDQGQRLVRQGEFSAALAQFQSVIATSKQPDSLNEAKRLYGVTCRQWIVWLERQRQFVNREIRSYGNYVARAEQQENDLDARLRSAQDNLTHPLEQDAALAKLRIDYDQARARYAASVVHLQDLLLQRSGLEQTIKEVHKWAAAYPGVGEQVGATKGHPAAPTPPANQPANTSSSQGTVLGDIADFVSRYWIYGSAAALVVLWLLSRLTTTKR